MKIQLNLLKPNLKILAKKKKMKEEKNAKYFDWWC
jgi:hypothetical protein